MHKKIIALAVATIIALPVTSEAFSLFKKNKKVNSTTITGYVEYVIEGQVVFKTVDGQVILLLGKKAANVATVKDYKVRIFGNVYAPSEIYPKGAINVRNFRILENEPAPQKQEYTEAAPLQEEEQIQSPAEPSEKVTSYEEPEPYIEPELVETSSETNVQNEPVVALSEEQHPGPYSGPIVAEEDDESKSTISAAEIKAKEPVYSNYEKYIIQPGDTLGKISKKIYGTTQKYKEIAAYNGIAPSDYKAIRVGKVLKIPVLSDK